MVRYDTSKKWFLNIIPPTTGGVKHHQNVSLTLLRDQISFKNEILHRWLFLWWYSLPEKKIGNSTKQEAALQKYSY